MRVHHLESNILRNNFYSAIKVEIFRLASSTLCVSGFYKLEIRVNKNP